MSAVIYKTVNICSLSRSSWRKVIKRLDRYISAGRLNEYYEVVFQEMKSDLKFACIADNQQYDSQDCLAVVVGET